MSKILMLVIGGAASLIVLQYFLMALRLKKYSKGKKAINEELLKLLKE